MEIAVLFEEGIEGDLPAPDWLQGVIEQTLVAERAGPTAEVSLLIAGQDRVHQLNRTFLGEDRPTDVLSFPMRPAAASAAGPAADEAAGGAGFVPPPDGLEHLGEVIISFPQAVVQAAEHGHATGREIAVLTVHGVLHLLGYDHDGPEAERKMQARERAILEQIADP
jgi:probable rRNA maturation factor